MQASQLADGLRRSAVWLSTGPFVVRLTSDIGELAGPVAMLYPENLMADFRGFADFHVAIQAPRGLRRWIRPQAEFLLDGHAPFKPLPRGQALPLLEWGLNWCIANYAHEFLVLHAAAIERNGRVAILPGAPGSGKSTLCAGLVYWGWRLLSDELALISLADGRIVPLARPISLKNESIEVIRNYVPNAVLSSPAHDTAKGTVALLRAPEESIARCGEAAPPAWVIMPRFIPGAPARLESAPKAEMFMEAASHGFNYSVHGARGFNALAALIDRSACLRFSYGDLDDAVALFDTLG